MIFFLRYRRYWNIFYFGTIKFGFSPSINVGFTIVIRNGKFPFLITMVLLTLIKALQKWWKILFISSKNLFTFFRHLNACFAFGLVGKWLGQKTKANFKFMESQNGQQINMHIFPNTSRSKDDQIMKFGQLIEYNERNIFSVKFIQKMRQGA